MRPTARWMKALTCMSLLCLCVGWALASDERVNLFYPEQFSEWVLCYEGGNLPGVSLGREEQISPEELGRIRGKGPAVNRYASDEKAASAGVIILWDEARVRDATGFFGRNLGSSRGGGAQANRLVTGGR